MDLNLRNVVIIALGIIFFIFVAIYNVASIPYDISKDRMYVTEVAERAFTESKGENLIIDAKGTLSTYYDLNEAFVSKKAMLENINLYYYHRYGIILLLTMLDIFVCLMAILMADE